MWTRPSPVVYLSHLLPFTEDFLSHFPPPVICCVFVSADSYLSVHTHPSLEAHELLRIVSLKMDRAEEEMVLAVMSHSGGTCMQMFFRLFFWHYLVFTEGLPSLCASLPCSPTFFLFLFRICYRRAAIAATQWLCVLGVPDPTRKTRSLSQGCHWDLGT